MLEDYLQKSLATLDHRNLRRRLRVSSKVTGAKVHFDNRTLHNFASNDYLGLAAHPRVIAAATEATQTYGAGTGSSRLLSGSQSPHEELEEKLAAFKDTAAALTFASGYAASTGVMVALADKNDVVLLDRLSHACLVDGARLSGATCRTFAHNDLGQLEHHLEWAGKKHPQAKVLIATESVFSMDGDLAPLEQIVELKDRYGAALILDEAHAVGILGKGGRGLAEQLGLGSRIEVQMGTLGKALGSAGGYVAGSRNLIDLLLNRARSFVYSTASPASNVAAASAALELSAGPEGDQRRAKLRQFCTLIDSNIPAAIHPIILGDEALALAAAEQLSSLGFFVPAIRPPTVPKGTSRLRVSLSASHDATVIKTLAGILQALSLEESLDPTDPDSICPVCGGTLLQEKCKVVCRSTICSYRIVFNCSEF